MMMEEEVAADKAAKPTELRDDTTDSVDSGNPSEHSEEEDGGETDPLKSGGASLSDEEGDSHDGPLTRAKLLTFAEMGEPWIAVGDGVVSVEITIESSSGAPADPPHATANGGKVGKAEEVTHDITSGLVCQRVARLEVADLDNPDEVLLSTPIDVEGLYQIRDEDIIMWNDAQLGRSMALQFNHGDGCAKILREITDFQKSELSKRDAVAAETLLGDTDATRGGKAGGSDIAGVRDKFAVTVANLPNIVDAVSTNPLIFGSYVREDMSYFRQLATLFDESKEKGDTASMEHIAQITLGLLGSPYNSEGKILGQFMESAYVDKCVDIVQYALGRRDKASGFVSFEERRATFKNPLHLPESVLQRIHLLYSALYLRDLLPLSLDDGDGGSPCVLNLLLIRFKFTLINEICTKPEFLQHAFDLSQNADPDKEALYSLAAFVQDMSKSIKNSPIPFDMKEEMYNTMVQGGLFSFCRSVLYWGLQDVQSEVRASGDPEGVAAAAAGEEPGTGRRTAAETAVEASCDVLSHCLFIVASARDSLASESKESPSRCSLALVMKCFSLMLHSSSLQAAYDVVLGAATGAQALQAFSGFLNLGVQRAIVRFWVEGVDGQIPPLFGVAAHVAGLLRRVGTEPAGGRPPPVWTHGEELQLVYGFRVLNTVAEKVEEGFRTSFAEVLKESGILAAACPVMERTHTRRLVNVQSSIVSFLTRLIGLGDGNVMRLFNTEAVEADGQKGDGKAKAEERTANPPSSEEEEALGERNLLSVCMALFMACARRNTILSAALGSLFVNLCTEVHHEKIQLAEAVSPSTLRPSFVTPMDGSNPLSPDVAGSGREEAAQRRYQKAAAALMAAFGDQLDEHAPVVADRLRSSLKETPEEAKRADAETSSLPSTIGRPGDNLADFDMMAMEFGVDVPLPASASRSLTSSPLSDAGIGASEDSLLSELADMDSSGSDDDDDDATGTEEGTSSSDSDEEDGNRGADGTGANDANKPVPPPGLDGEEEDSSTNSSNRTSSSGRDPEEEETVGSRADTATARVSGQKRERPEAVGDDGATAQGTTNADASSPARETESGSGGDTAGQQPPAKKPKAQKRSR